jgi:AcrR family transcriptional regulator
MKDTRRRILGLSLRLFNERGLRQVGVRDIARALDLSPGNFVYHFATKDKLVEALVREYFDAQDAVVQRELPPTLEGFYAAVSTAMRNQVAYRFIFLSYVDSMRSSRELAALEKRREKRRRKNLDIVTGRYVESGVFDKKLLAERRERIRDMFTILLRGWLATSEFSDVRRTTDESIAHHAKLAVALYEPCCTARGRRQLRRVMERDFAARV